MGIATNYYFEEVDPEVEAAVLKAITVLEGLGVESREVTMPSLKYAASRRWTLIVERVVAQESYLDDYRQDYGPDVSSGPHHQDSGEAKIRESTAGVSRKPSSDCKACGCSSKHLCGLTAWNT